MDMHLNKIGIYQSTVAPNGFKCHTNWSWCFSNLKTVLFDARSEIQFVRHCNFSTGQFAIFNSLERIIFRPANRSYLEERLLEIIISSRRLNKLTEQKHSALYNLRDDSTIMTKGAFSFYQRFENFFLIILADHLFQIMDVIEKFSSHF